MRLLIKLSLLLLAVSFFPPLPSSSVSALNGNDFPFGRIIDSTIFHNSNSMTVAEIQAFLESKVQGGSCDRYRPTYNSNYNPPWTCLFEFQQNPTTGQNNYGQFNPDGSPASVPGGQSAAQIIWQASQDYGVNPQVLIVLLQKEQGLVTDNWPWTIQYSKATGYRCPDTAPCDPAGADFVKQVRGAAASFIYYMDNDGLWYPVGANNILYNPNQACGRRPTNIENLQTSALYLYTPYVPNQAALNNLYGTGDSCSAYGNRNFWRYFNDWFGSTHVASYNYSFVSANVGAHSLEPDEEYMAEIVLKNTGNKTWYADGSVPTGERPTRLANLNYQSTPFADTTDPAWLGTRNQIRMVEASVDPGENATFRFRLKGTAQLLNTSHVANVAPVVDGVGFMNYIGMAYLAKGERPDYRVVSSPGPTYGIIAGDTVEFVYVLENLSSKTWYADGSVPTGERPTRLANLNYQSTPFADTTDPAWLGTRNQIRMVEASVDPGENATFRFRLKGTYAGGAGSLSLRPVLDGQYLLKDKLNPLGSVTPQPSYSYSFIGAVDPPATMSPGQKAVVTVRLRNEGNAIWRSDGNNGSNIGSVRLGTIRPFYNSSPLFDALDANWLTSSQIQMKTAVVGPGQIAEFEVSLEAPALAGKYIMPFAPVIDGVAWLNDIGLAFTINVVE